MAQTYYELLEIPLNATPEQIRASYRQQSIKWHPDRNPGNKEAEERFKSVSEAYAVLSSPDSRAAYDRALGNGTADTSFRTQRMDPETAANMFLNEMIQLAYELTFGNVKWTRIAEELKKRGCPEEIANMISKGVETQRKSAVRKSAGRALLLAVGAIVVGTIVTTISYNAAAPGGTYWVSIGLFLYGGYNIIRALYFVISGRAPRQK